MAQPLPLQNKKTGQKSSHYLVFCISNCLGRLPLEGCLTLRFESQAEARFVKTLTDKEVETLNPQFQKKTITEEERLRVVSLICPQYYIYCHHAIHILNTFSIGDSKVNADQPSNLPRRSSRSWQLRSSSVDCWMLKSIWKISWTACLIEMQLDSKKTLDAIFSSDHGRRQVSTHST